MTGNPPDNRSCLPEGEIPVCEDCWSFADSLARDLWNAAAETAPLEICAISYVFLAGSVLKAVDENPAIMDPAVRRFVGTELEKLGQKIKGATH
jgi:hypothetical protein